MKKRTRIIILIILAAVMAVVICNAYMYTRKKRAEHRAEMKKKLPGAYFYDDFTDEKYNCVYFLKDRKTVFLFNIDEIEAAKLGYGDVQNIPPSEEHSYTCKWVMHDKVQFQLEDAPDISMSISFYNDCNWDEATLSVVVNGTTYLNTEPATRQDSDYAEEYYLEQLELNKDPEGYINKRQIKFSERFSTITTPSVTPTPTPTRRAVRRSSKSSSDTNSHDDPYDVYDYGDPEEFYEDYPDDFEDEEDAEDYYDEAWDDY